MHEMWLALPTGILISTVVSSIGIGGGILWMPFLLVVLKMNPETAVSTSLLIQTFGKPILAVGGGGYDIENTVRAWALCWTALCGKDNPHENMEPGGVMMESTERYGGLRDREIFPDEVYRKEN